MMESDSSSLVSLSSSCVTIFASPATTAASLFRCARVSSSALTNSFFSTNDYNQFKNSWPMAAGCHDQDHIIIIAERSEADPEQVNTRSRTGPSFTNQGTTQRPLITTSMAIDWARNGIKYLASVHVEVHLRPPNHIIGNIFPSPSSITTILGPCERGEPGLPIVAWNSQSCSISS